MANCCHNVFDSLHKRYLKDTPPIGSLDWKLVERIVCDLAMRIRDNMTPFDKDTFLSSKKGRVRGRYVTAATRINREGFDLVRDSNISAFVKLERYFEKGKSPRMIMGRNPKFNIPYAQIIEPIEKAFFSLPQVANACDNIACGEKFSRLVGQWFMENDMSKFEASQRFKVLRLEFMVYSLVLPQHQRLIDRLFAQKLRKRGHTNTGVSFDFDECRGSGDLDTSLGNGILNYIATQYNLIKNFCPTCSLTACAEPGCMSYRFVVKGDDSYSSIPRFANFVNYYCDFGFDAKIIIRKRPEDVEFCSGHFIEVRPGKFVYVQKLQKLIDSLRTCINADAVRNGWVSHYYKSLGLMYKKLYSGIPVYEDIADFLIKTNNFGLNTNLINSHNLLDMFSNYRNEVLDTDESLCMMEIALVNKLEIAELERIKYWCRASSLKFPPQFSKRCNLRQIKGKDLPLINFEQINDQILDVELEPRASKYYTRLKQYRQLFMKRNC